MCSPAAVQQPKNNSNCYGSRPRHGETLVDYYNRIKYSTPISATHPELFQAAGTTNGQQLEATPRGAEAYTGFGNDFTDDTLWITIALLQM